MNIVVTGASGLIGGAVVRLLAESHSVIGVARGTAPIPLKGGVTPMLIDLGKPDSVSTLVSHAPELIVHAAAVLPPAFSAALAQEAAAQNRVIDDSILLVARRTGCPLIYMSGTSLYGCVDVICSEDSAVNPRGPYLKEKRRTEEETLGLASGGTVLRVSSPYGVGQRTSTVLQKFVKQALSGNDLLCYGTGAREQDFLAVDDVASAVRAAAGTGCTGIFNIASGQPITMKHLATLVIQTVGSGKSRVRPAGAADPEEHCRARIDITKAAQELHWHPTVDLPTGIRGLAAYWSQTFREKDESTGPE